MQQLRLVSAQEDLGHQKVYIDALSAECSRRQALNVNLQDQLQLQSQQAAKVESHLAQACHKSTSLQVITRSAVAHVSTSYSMQWTHIMSSAKHALISDMLCKLSLILIATSMLCKSA